MSTQRGGKRARKSEGKQAKGRKGGAVAAVLPFCREECKRCEAIQELIKWEQAQEQREERKLDRGLKKSPKSTVRKEMPKVLKALLKEAKAGNCPHAKLLFEFADMESVPDEAERARSQSLTELLLSKIEGRKD